MSDMSGSRPPAHHIDLTMESVVDRTLLIDYNGKLWPVVMCDFQTLPEKFLQIRPIDEEHLPAILLGRHKFVWVKAKCLREYDLCHEYLSKGERFSNDMPLRTDTARLQLEKQRRRAFSVEAPELQDSLYWCNYIKQDRTTRRLERSLDAKSWLKRSVSTNDEGGRPRKSRFKASLGLNQRQVKGRKDATSELTIQPKEEPESNDEIQTIFSQDVLKGYCDEKCTIIVAKDKKSFVLPLPAITSVESLANRQVWTSDRGFHVNLSETFSFPPDTFQPIYEYLRHGDFSPTITNHGGEDSLQGLYSSGQTDKFANHIARTYQAASMLQIANLQALCFRKLAVLDLTPYSLLRIAEAFAAGEKWGVEGEDSREQWLVQRLAKMFHRLVEQDGAAFGKLLRRNKEMERAILISVLEMSN